MFRRAFKPNESPLVDQDVLSCGPTPATYDLGAWQNIDRKSTRLNSSHTVIYTLSLHDALPIYVPPRLQAERKSAGRSRRAELRAHTRHLRPRRMAEHRSEEHTSELQSHSDLHSFPTRRSSDLCSAAPSSRTKVRWSIKTC